ncbi:energy transducer TonB [Mucilaginibacter aquatilis]|uniref:TonB family protein n=1 Tax=Mucilaginibacter aquatilis TaxID=1517760 RepID=A0A6I4ICD1_9SPHI|nr:energy transducer TonB [Mucilaginibacter aquatilis]MVN92940.1 TonB family protein [Mucilaginibacter aquatilis]
MKFIITLSIALCCATIASAQTSKQTAESNQVYSVAQKMPVFMGGNGAFEKYIAKNLRYPKKAKDKKIQGKVYVSMIIEKDGSVKNVKAERGASPELNAEAVRIVSSSPKWTPGQQNGKAVRVYQMVPIEFSLL